MIPHKFFIRIFKCLYNIWMKDTIIGVILIKLFTFCVNKEKLLCLYF